MPFTVSHDASHHSISSIEGVNLWIGRVATLLFAPHAGFRTWRFIHMQHHRFTNHDDGSEPDHFTNRGPRWQRPLGWLTVDLYYMVFYVPKLRARNRVGLERLVSPLLLYQNYHLVHHLHPIVPFHRYITVWRRREEDYLAAEPALSDLRGRPITTEAYRCLRELAQHDH
jgi:fatty acid desaturase